MDSLKPFLRVFGVIFGTLWLSIYTVCRVQYINFSPWIVGWSLLLFLAELHTIFHLYGMFYSLWPRRYPQWETLNRDRNLRCNIFICVCGEPPALVRETILAARETAHVYSITIEPYFEPRVIVLNDGKCANKDNWQEIAAICRELNVIHIARSTAGGFKAGNINNGLRMTPSSDAHNTLDIVFDSDFRAKPEFLIEMTKPFADETISFCQSPQRYTNERTWVAQAAAAHQIFFFQHICPAKGHDNALFLCGTNFAIRRSALESVGLMETRWIIEDYATSLNLHLQDHKGVFMSKVLALGMAPSSLKQYFNQQNRWAKGSFDVTRFYLKEFFIGRLTFKQKMHYLLSATYYFIGMRDLILMLAPLPYLYFGISLVNTNTLKFLLLVYLPMIVGNFLMYAVLFRHPLKSLVLDVISFPVFTQSFFASLFNRQLGFVVTIKKYERENTLRVYLSQLAVTFALLSGMIFSVMRGGNHGTGSLINYWWALWNTTFLLIGFFLILRENSSWGSWDVKNQEETRDATPQLHSETPVARLTSRGLPSSETAETARVRSVHQ